jgi:hypothetical protein
VNVLRDTHQALAPGGDLLDFHPVVPPWARVVSGVRTIGFIDEPDFPDQLRAAEEGIDEVVRLGLFQHVASRTRRLREHYDDAREVVDEWELEGELEQRLREVDGPVDVVDKVVFRLYRRS